MEHISEVLAEILPGVEWSLVGDNFEDINWHGKKAPITEQEFQIKWDALKAKREQDKADKAAARAALLDRLGITAEEAALLLG
jgi:hypothetical protein